MWHCGHGFVVCTHSKFGLLLVLLAVFMPSHQTKYVQNFTLSELFFVSLWGLRV
jgi:hypothetical protein